MTAPADTPMRPSSSSSDRRIAHWLGACALLLYLPFFHGHFYGTDETSVYQGARALYTQGSLAVDSPAPHHFTGRGGHLYSHFAPGQSVLAVPLFGLGGLFRTIAPESWQHAIRGRPRDGDRIDTLANPEIFAVALYSPLASAFLVALFFRLERRLGSSVRAAVIASLLLGCTTYVAMMSVYFLRHTTEAIAILGSIYFLIDRKQGGPLRSLALGSGLADHERDRVGKGRAHVGEVDALAVDRRGELREAVQLRFVFAPVVLLAPVVGEVLERGLLDAVFPVGVLHGLGPAGALEALAQISQRRVGHRDLERLDALVGHLDPPTV